MTSAESESVEELKGKGNKAFSAGEYRQAIEYFTQALKQDPNNHILYSNRSAAHSSLKAYEDALNDADKAIELQPQWPKGYSRKGAALFGLQRFQEAEQVYSDGLQHDPSNVSLQKGLQQVTTTTNQQSQPHVSDQNNPFGSLFGGDLAGKLAANPETAKLLSDSQFMKMLMEVKADPQKMTQYLQDPRMMQALGALFSFNQDPTTFNESQDLNDLKGGDLNGEPIKQVQKEQDLNLKQEEQEEQEEDEEWKREKEMGNECYKKREFDEALEHYGKAWALNQSDITILTNRAAVYFEQSRFDECIQQCTDAVDRGRELRADFKLIAKAYARMANAHLKQSNLQSAIKFYEKSLAENRTAEVLQRLRECERQLKEQERLAYLDPVKAEEARTRGNELFKDGKFAEAVQFYSESIKRSDSDPRAYSNRAACYTKLMALPEALKDAERAIELDQTFVKAYIRKAAIQFTKRDFVDCVKTCDEALAVDAEHHQGKHRGEIEAQKMRAQNGIYGYDASSSSSSSAEKGDENLTQEEKARRAMQDPKIQEIMSDPVMQQILQQMSSDPAAAQDHMKNPVIRQKIQQLISAGVIGVR
jgi:stress-induced-phosphoprotein 1